MAPGHRSTSFHDEVRRIPTRLEVCTILICLYTLSISTQSRLELTENHPETDALWASTPQNVVERGPDLIN